MNDGRPSEGQVARALREPPTTSEDVAAGSALRVSSWNEWDSLRHVIVGGADRGEIPACEPGVNAKVPEDSAMRGQWGTRPPETIAMANAQLDDFAALLEKRRIRVD